MAHVVIDPVTRIEGHLKIDSVIENGQIIKAQSSGVLFRGLELILHGRDPRDAPIITQRICGVCPVPHAVASTLSLDDAFGLVGRIPNNGRIIRNLILGADLIQSHILHFYHLAALDYVDIAQVAHYEGDDAVLRSIKDFIARGEGGPFLPRYEGDYRLPPKVSQQAAAHYVEALHMRRKAHEMMAIFGGKAPHQVGIVPGGATQAPTVDKITAFLWHLNGLREFIDHAYLPDVLAVAQAYSDYFTIGAGCKHYLSYGMFDLEASGAPERWLKGGSCTADLLLKPLDPSLIREQVRHSWYEDATTDKHPSQGETKPQPGKPSGYSWMKAPRYGGQAAEVGPLARMLVNYAAGHPVVRQTIDGVLSALGAPATALMSVLGRHAARAVECKIVADAMADWVIQLQPAAPAYLEYALPVEAEGMGLTEAPRGALGHWVKIQDRVIANYQAVVPTTWNCCPRDDQEQPGPLEQALIGAPVKDKENPFEIVRIVRSFDPCLACAIH